MILVDLQQVMISNLIVTLGKHINRTEVDENFLRHLVLNSIRSYNMKYGDKYGEMVLACDASYSWRKKVFPYYKANRKRGRDESALDWNVIFGSLNKIREELKENFPYRVIHVDGAEADDVIAALCEEYGDTNQKILILSGDKDFRQLQSYINIEQFDPVRKKALVENQPERYLKEHIMRGDGSDGIPNFLSDDDTFLTDKRQKNVSQKKLDGWLDQKPEDFCDEKMLRGYKRNEQLIDLNFIPKDIKAAILEEFKAQAGKDRKNLFNYFIENRLKLLMEKINDF